MEKRILKFIVKKEFAAWASMVDCVFELGKLCIENREEVEVSNMIIRLEETVPVGETVCDLKRRVGKIYEKYALCSRSRKYVKRRFLKECLPYAQFFVRELTFRPNMSVLASHSRRQIAMASVHTIQIAIKPLVKPNIVTISEDFERI